MPFPQPGKSTKFKSVNVYVETIKKNVLPSKSLNFVHAYVADCLPEKYISNPRHLYLTPWTTTHFNTPNKHYLLTWPEYYCPVLSTQQSAVSMGPRCLLPLLVVMSLATSSSLVRSQRRLLLLKTEVWD